MTFRRALRHWPIAAVVGVGLFMALRIAGNSLGFGDGAIYYVLARAIARGEHFYKDVVHLRVPGDFAVGAACVRVRDSFASADLCGRLSSYVLTPVCVYVFGLVVSRSRVIAGSAAALIVVMPGYFSLRIGVNLLAMAAYVVARRRSSGRGLIIAGALLGLGLLFGQEVALLGALVVTAESLSGEGPLAKRIERVLLVGVGAALVLLPYSVYLAIFSSFRNFLFYAIYFALILQPRTMDLPFPPLTLAHIGYYVPLVVYAAYFAAIQLRGRMTAGRFVLLAFGTVRFVTAMGRSDFPHLLFVLPEVLVMAPLAAVEWLAAIRQPRDLLRSPRVGRVAVLTGALVVLEWASIDRGPLLLAALPLYMAGRKVGGPPVPMPLRRSARTVAAVAALTAMAAGLGGSIRATVVGEALRDPVGYGPMRVSGALVTPAEHEFVREVRDALRRLRVRALFSFPNQSFFYSLVSRRTTRFVYFEPSMTAGEKEGVVRELRRRRPEAVIFEPLSMLWYRRDFSGIVDFVTTNYRIDQEVTTLNHLWIMVPKPQPALEQHLLYRTPGMDPEGARLRHFRAPDGRGGFLYGFEARTQARFSVRGGRGAVLRVRTADGRCGTVLIRGRSEQVCSAERRIDLSRYGGRRVTIVLRPGPDGTRWVDPTVESAAG